MFSFIFLLVMTAITFVLSEVLRPKPNIQNAKRAHLGDFQFPTATQGRVVPVIWGTVLLSGPNVVWYGDLKPKAITKKIKTGMFSSKTQTTGYKYYVGMDMALCRGDIDGVTQILIGNHVAWNGFVKNGPIVINEPKLLGGIVSGQGGVVGTLNLYSGNASQTADPFMAGSPENYLWFDDFSQGLSNQGLHRFKNSTPGIYYWVSDIGTGTNFAPGSTLITDIANVIKTATGTVGGTPTHIFNTETNSSAPGDQHVYTAILQHPDRVRLADKIKVLITFYPPGPTVDGGSIPTTNVHLGVGCRYQDLPPFTNNYGISVTVHNQKTIQVWLSTPTTGGASNIKTLTSGGGDFTQMSAATHTVELHVEANKYTILLDGAVIWSATDARIAEIPGDNQGFLLTYSGNANTNFNTPLTDWTNVGIYNFGIDQVGRPITNDVPAYRGTAHGVWQGGYLGTSTQIQPWSFVTRRCPNGLALTSGMELVNNSDANPMNVLYEILTDPDWGMGFQSSDIDLTNFRANATTLYNEGNGFSGVLDTTKQGTDLKDIITQQIDGLLFIDRTTGLWKIKLARNDYTLSACPALNETNLIEIKSFSRGAWAETTNNVRVAIVNRDNSYQADYGIAQDMANVRIQNGAVITSEEQYTGVKNKTLANQIAWRDLRMLSYPIAKAQVTTDRSLAGLNPGDVIRWTDASLGFTDMAMRTSRIDLGKLEEGIVTLDVVQDVFQFTAPSYADPQQTNWQFPTTPQSALPKDPTDRYVMEAPLALCRVAEENPGLTNRIWAGARDPGDGSSSFDIWAADGANDYADNGSVGAYLTAGQLHAALDASGVQGSISIVVDTTPDVAEDILLNLSNASPVDIGKKLFNIVVIDNEFLAFQTIADSGGGTLTLGGVYRGVMDTAPASHLINSRVWFLCGGGNITANDFGPGDTVGVKLLTFGLNGSLDIGLSQATNIVMANRVLKPYPPVNMVVNTVLYTSTTSIDSGLSIGFTRRDFRYTDEVKGLVDESHLPADFPTANTTQYALSIYEDPSGRNDLALTTTWASTDPITLTFPHLLRTVFDAQAALTVPPVANFTFNGGLGGTVDLPADFAVYKNISTSGIGNVLDAHAIQQVAGGLSVQTESDSTAPYTTAYLTNAVFYPLPAKHKLSAHVQLDEQMNVFALIDRLDRVGFTDNGVLLQVQYNAGASDHGVTLTIYKVIAGAFTSLATFTTADFYNGGGVSQTVLIEFENDGTNGFKGYLDGVLLVSASTSLLSTNTGVGFGYPGPYTSFGFNSPGDFGALDFVVLDGTSGYSGGGGSITFPARLRASIATRHTVASVVYTATQNLVWDFNVSSTSSALFNWGNLPVSTNSANYTAASTGTFSLHLTTALASGAVQVSINGGAYSTVIAALATSGTFAVTSGQTISVKHTQSGIVPSESMLTLVDPATHAQAFAILTF